MNNSIVYPKLTKLHIYKQSMDKSKLITSEIHVINNLWALCSPNVPIDKVIHIVNCILNYNIKT